MSRSRCGPNRRLWLWESSRRQCHYCHAPLRTPESMTVDHVLPKVDGGGEADQNLVASCVHCNRTKGSRSYAEFAADLWETRGIRPAQAAPAAKGTT